MERGKMGGYDEGELRGGQGIGTGDWGSANKEL